MDDSQQLEKLRFELKALGDENRMLKRDLEMLRNRNEVPEVRVAYVTMIKNSEKLIGHHLNYYHNIGIRDFFICDNGSTDGSRQLIYQFRERHPKASVIVLDDPTVGYYQSSRMTALAALAFDYGCNWILPVDDDEILCCKEGPFDLPSFIRKHIRVSDSASMSIARYEYVPCQSDDASVSNPFLRLTKRESNLSKPNQTVLIKWGKGLSIAQGNHRVYGSAKVISSENNPLYIAHFPLFDLEHMKTKAIQGGRAYEAATNLYPTQGLHWKYFYDQYKKNGEAALQRIFQEWKDSKGELVDDPLDADAFNVRSDATVPVLSSTTHISVS